MIELLFLFLFIHCKLCLSLLTSFFDLLTLPTVKVKELISQPIYLKNSETRVYEGRRPETRRAKRLRSSTGKERGGSPSKQARKSVPSNPVSKKEEPEVQSGAGSEVIGQPGEEVTVKEGLSEGKKRNRKGQVIELKKGQVIDH